MPQSIATIRDLVADLQKADEDHLKQFNSTARVACVAIWDVDTTANGAYLRDSMVQFTVQDIAHRRHLLHWLRAGNIAYMLHIMAQLTAQEL